VASMDAVAAHEDSLLQLVEGAWPPWRRGHRHSRAGPPHATLIPDAARRRTGTPTRPLPRLDVLAPACSFYALEAFRALRLDDEHGLRVGLAPTARPPTYTADRRAGRLPARVIGLRGP